MRRKHKIRNYRFTEKKQSRKGMLGVLLGLISLGIGIGMMISSALAGGNGSVYLGSGGFFAMILAVVAMVLAIQSIHEENSYRVFPVAAMLVSVITLCGWIVIYAAGFILA